MAMSLHKRISFDSIESIEFEEDQLTNFRRIDPRFQLNCLGEHCDQYGFERVECSKKKDLPKTDDERNQLINYQSSHWDCFAFYTNLNGSEENLLLVDDQFRFACEGWRHDQDDFILQGSCSLNYTFISEKTSKNQITTPTPSGYKNDPKYVWFFTTLFTFFMIFIWIKLTKTKIKTAINSLFFVTLIVIKHYKLKIQIEFNSLNTFLFESLFGQSLKVSNLKEEETSN